MKLRIFADISLLAKDFVKQDKEKFILVTGENMPISDFKPDTFRSYVCDNTGNIYFTEQKVLTFQL